MLGRTSSIFSLMIINLSPNSPQADKKVGQKQSQNEADVLQLIWINSVTQKAGRFLSILRYYLRHNPYYRILYTEFQRFHTLKLQYITTNFERFWCNTEADVNIPSRQQPAHNAPGRWTKSLQVERCFIMTVFTLSKNQNKTLWIVVKCILISIKE